MVKAFEELAVRRVLISAGLEADEHVACELGVEAANIIAYVM